MSEATDENKITRRQAIIGGLKLAGGVAATVAAGTGAAAWIIDSGRKQKAEEIARAVDIPLERLIADPRQYEGKIVKTLGFSAFKEERSSTSFTMRPAGKGMTPNYVTTYLEVFNLALTPDKESPSFLVEENSGGLLQTTIKASKDPAPRTLVFGSVEKRQLEGKQPEYFISPIKVDLVR